jgi:hypothetical protein
MIKNFDAVKRQLEELSDAINKFKSEAVQLKIVELIFKNAGLSSDEEEPGTAGFQEAKATHSRKGKRRKAVPKAEPGSEPKKARTKAQSTSGPGATLRQLVDNGFFKQGRRIGDIRNHCETKLALRFKSNELSPPLMRLVRDGTLQRERNAENQFEYTQN